jgi:hypothetical protein
MRRFAIRPPRDYTGAMETDPNRREDGTPDTSRVPPPLGTAPPPTDETNKYVVDVRDTLVTSTRGFIVSDRRKLQQTISASPTPDDLVNPASGWLPQTRPGGLYEKFARHVLIGQHASRESLKVQ